MSSEPMRIFYVAYPLHPVSRESCGGAEQVLWTLASEMALRGHHAVTAACAGSQVPGELFPTGPEAAGLDAFEQRNAEHVAKVLDFLANAQRSTRRFDIVHDNSGSFWRYAGEVDAPVVATLHLPRGLCREEYFRRLPSNVYFNCVSESQRATFADLPAVLGVVRNGIRLQDFPPPPAPSGGYLLWLGRICEEKGTHVAIKVARQSGHRLVIAGDVYPFSYHQQYFDREVRPHLEARGANVTFVRRPSSRKKIDLLRHARALLLPSLVDETSSLVAMEAMACGTPVVAFRRGAVPEVVEHRITGFVVNTAEEMVGAVAQLGEIDAAGCRAHVEKNFGASRMTGDYLRLYERSMGMAERDSN